MKSAPDIFISYASEDRERARVLASALETRRWTVFWDQTISPSVRWTNHIESALKKARCVIVLWSAASAESPWIYREGAFGQSQGRVLFVLFDDVPLPSWAASIQAVDLVSWNGDERAEGFLALVRGVTDILALASDKSGEPPSPGGSEIERELERGADAEGVTGAAKKKPTTKSAGPESSASDGSPSTASSKSDAQTQRSRKRARLKRLLRWLSLGLAIFAVGQLASVLYVDFRLWRNRPFAENFNLDPKTLGPGMVVIPAGRFTMGSPGNEEGRSTGEGPQRLVNINKPFALGRYEVTFDEYDHFAQETNRELPDDEGWGRGRRPVINVSWDDAQAYAAWLSEKTGQAYRLPSEAEWEYAARAGTTTSRYWGDDPKQACAYANVDDPSHGCQDGYENQTAPVGSFKANGFGLQDMLGNAWEWVEDCWHGNYDGAPNDGSAWEQKDCGSRVLRGGSWGNEPGSVRAASRAGPSPDNRPGLIGFRLARTLE